MTKKTLIYLFSILIVAAGFGLFAFSQEQLTITTYYPSPYGVYNKLRLFPHSESATCSNGELYYNGTSILLCEGSSWVPLASGQTLWQRDTYGVSLKDNTWNVGIGGASSQYAGLSVDSTGSGGGGYSGIYSLLGGSGTQNSAVEGIATDGTMLCGIHGLVTSGSGVSPTYGAYGVWGQVLGGINGGVTYGVEGDAAGNGTVNYGVYGDASGAATNWAGYFTDGNMYIKNHLDIGTNGTASWGSPLSVSHDQTNLDFVVDSNGAVGVGTSPSCNFDVVTGPTSPLRLGHDNSGDVLEAWSAETNIISDNGGGEIRFKVPATNTEMTVYPDSVNIQGNLTIGGNLTVLSTMNSTIAGTLNKGGGGFLIDDPLDPKNKTLQHSFVESPEMRNVYYGQAETVNGSVTINLPAWWTALNGKDKSEYNYQFTPMGKWCPLYVVKEIENNSFTVASQGADCRFSWTVSAVRHDSFAQKRRIPVEKEKDTKDRGKCIYPEACRVIIDNPEKK